MSADFGIVLPLWCFDKDAPELLHRAVGEIGLQHITCPVVSGACVETILSSGRGTPHFETEGGWHYPPESGAFSGLDIGHLKPRAARWVGGRNTLAPLADELARRNIRCIARVDLLGVRWLAEHQPHLARRNAWGDERVSAGLCPLQPQVRELLLGTCSDLRRFAPAGIELANWGLDSVGSDVGARRAEFENVDPRTAALLAICFCSACRAIAGAKDCDADAAARVVRARVAAIAEAGPDGTRPGSEPDAALEQYRQVRAEGHLRWLATLARHCEPWERFLLAPPDPLGAAALPDWRTLLDAAAQLAAPHPGAARERLRIAAGVDAVRVPAWSAGQMLATELVRSTSELCEAGVTYFDFEAVHAAPRAALAWVRQAVRYARRV